MYGEEHFLVNILQKCVCVSMHVTMLVCIELRFSHVRQVILATPLVFIWGFPLCCSGCLGTCFVDQGDFQQRDPPTTASRGTKGVWHLVFQSPLYLVTSWHPAVDIFKQTSCGILG